MKQVLLRPASADDFESFYAIKADANNIKWGGFDKAPQKDTFESWYIKQLAPCSKRKIFLLQVENKIVGFSSVNFTEPNKPELSYGVLSEEAGNGYGTEILKRTTEIIGGVFLLGYQLITAHQCAVLRRLDTNKQIFPKNEIWPYLKSRSYSTSG